MLVGAGRRLMARSVATITKVGPGVVVLEVRRLGVDYFLDKTIRHRLPVARTRAARHGARWALFRPFRKVARGPLAFQAAFLPGAL